MTAPYWPGTAGRTHIEDQADAAARQLHDAACASGIDRSDLAALPPALVARAVAVAREFRAGRTAACAHIGGPLPVWTSLRHRIVVCEQCRDSVHAPVQRSRCDHCGTRAEDGESVILFGPLAVIVVACLECRGDG